MDFSTLRSGITALISTWQEIVIILACVAIAGLTFSSIFISLIEKDKRLLLVILFGSWSLLSIIAPIMYILGVFDPLIFYPLVVIGFAIIIARWKYLKPILFSNEIAKDLLVSYSLLLLFMILYLGHLDSIVLPPHHDAPTHFQIVQYFLGKKVGRTISIAGISNMFYHQGFHWLAAFFALLTGHFKPLDLSLLGIFLLAIYPVYYYILVKSITEKRAVGFLAAIMAGVGWPLPLHAINWSKFPLLAGLALFPLVLTAIFISHQKKSKKFLLIIIPLLFLQTWLHSRFVIALMILALAYFLVYKILLGKEVALILLAGAIMIEIFFSPGEAFKYLTGIYLFSTLIALVLLPFALKQNQKLTLIAVICALLLYLSINIPVPQFFQKYTIYLIDTPFFQTVILIPIITTCSLGVARFHETLNKNLFNITCVVFIIALAVNAGSTQSFEAIDATNFSNTNDLIAFDWITENIPADSMILISGRKSLNKWEGQDAGIWIKSLSGVDTKYVSYRTEWSDRNKVDMICEKYSDFGSLYIYQGAMSNSFNEDEIAKQDSFQRIFQLPKAEIFQLSCNY